MGGLSEAEREALREHLGGCGCCYADDVVDMQATIADLIDARVSAALAGVEALAEEWEADAVRSTTRCPDDDCGACTMGNLATMLRAAISAARASGEGDQ